MSQISDYEGFPIRRKRPELGAEVDAPWTSAEGASEATEPKQPPLPIIGAEDGWKLSRGHTITFVALFLFSIVLYFRPYELIPALSSYKQMAFFFGMLAIIVYLPSQFIADGNLTTRPREITLILLLVLAAFLSMPLATSPGEAYQAFTEVLLKAVVIFIIFVNVVRTEWRLKLLIWLAFAVSIYLSWFAISDYSNGVFREGNAYWNNQRIGGAIGALFGNSNDLALHLVTMVPLAVGFAFATKSAARKLLYIGFAVLFVSAIVVTFSRGGFIGLFFMLVVLARKVGRKNKMLSTGALIAALTAVLIFAPATYSGRLSSIFNSATDFTGSSSQRTEILKRSIWVTLRYPLTGVGIGNFHYKSVQELVTHNAYTEVSSEMGIPALVIYLMFMIYPLRRLRKIEEQTFDDPKQRKMHYWSIGIQASIVAYMAASFFASVAYQWYIYYIIGYAVALRRLYYIEQVKNGQ